MNNVFSIHLADVRIDDKAEVSSHNTFYSKIIHLMSRKMIDTQFDYDALMSSTLGYLHYEGFFDDQLLDEIKIYNPSGKFVNREALSTEI
jgi:hypothetical protein